MASEYLSDVRAHLFEREVKGQRGVMEDPLPFLDELEVYIAEPNEVVLANMLLAQVNRSHIWTRILLLSKLRENGDAKWNLCEPAIRRFWERAAPIYFSSEEFSLLKQKLFESIFGEQNGTA